MPGQPASLGVDAGSRELEKDSRPSSSSSVKDLSPSGEGAAQGQTQGPGLEASHPSPPAELGLAWESLLLPQALGPPSASGLYRRWWQGAGIPERLVRVVIAWQYCSSSIHTGWSLGAWLGPAA